MSDIPLDKGILGGLTRWEDGWTFDGLLLWRNDVDPDRRLFVVSYMKGVQLDIKLPFLSLTRFHTRSPYWGKQYLFHWTDRVLPW